jgi:hypothetical protein
VSKKQGTTTEEPTAAEPAGDQWYFLVDPAWRPEAIEELEARYAKAAEKAEDGGPGPSPADGAATEGGDAEELSVEPPPLGALVGGWLVSSDGTVSRFQPNPHYQPATPDSPTDPMDAVLRLFAKGEVDADAMFAVLKEAVFAIALDPAGDPLIAPSPDGVSCLFVATAPAHQPRVMADSWREQTAAELADTLDEHKVDALFNPGASTSTRLLAAAVRRGAEFRPEESGE